MISNQSTVNGSNPSIVHCSIEIKGCDDNTCFEMDMTEKEFEFMQRVCSRTVEISTYDCMPTMSIRKNNLKK